MNLWAAIDSCLAQLSCLWFILCCVEASDAHRGWGSHNCSTPLHAFPKLAVVSSGNRSDQPWSVWWWKAKHLCLQRIVECEDENQVHLPSICRRPRSMHQQYRINLILCSARLSITLQVLQALHVQLIRSFTLARRDEPNHLTICWYCAHGWA